MRRPRGSHRSATPRNQLAHASSRSPPRRRLIWASVPPSATTGCVPSPHNAAPHGGDGRRRGFSISHDAVGSVVAIGESLGYLRRPRTLRPPALFSGGGKSALARTPRLGPAEGRPRRPDCVPAARTPPLAPATIAPNRLESPPEHLWARRSAVLRWYAGAERALPLKSGRNWAGIRVQHGANARRGRSTRRRRSAARVFHLPRRGGECGCDRVAPLLPAGGAGAAAAGAILRGWEKRPSAQRSIGATGRRAVRAGCPTVVGTAPLAPATIAPNRLESPPEHLWARRSAVLPHNVTPGPYLPIARYQLAFYIPFW